MTNQKSLLAAIRAAPEDDAPRVVYADWLEEHGDEVDLARADFIRTQCRLAHLPEDDPVAFDLRWRQDELLAAHGRRWAEEVPAWARPECVFRRGFVDRVKTTVTKFIQSGKGLSRTVPVREVSLSAAPERIEELAAC